MGDCGALKAHAPGQAPLASVFARAGADYRASVPAPPRRPPAVGRQLFPALSARTFTPAIPAAPSFEPFAPCRDAPLRHYTCAHLSRPRAAFQAGTAAAGCTQARAGPGATLEMKSQQASTLRTVALRAAVVVVASSALLLAACGDKKDKASQTAAKVNRDEITVHQINFVLQQQRGLKPEQADAASHQILERLIDQQLAVQKADDLKLDRDPRVVQQLEAVKREVLARAYFEKIGEAAAKPTAEDIHKYYEDNPALFKDRRIYNLQEIAIEARPDQVATLRTQLEGAKNINDFVDYLKANDYRFTGSQAVRAAEQLPLQSLKAFAQLKDGQAMVNQTPTGVQVIVLAGSRSQPVGEEQAKPAIEQFLLNERKRKLVEDDLKSLRAAAKIEYVGKFAESAASAPAAAPAPAPALAPAASGALGADDISKGMGLKK